MFNKADIWLFKIIGVLFIVAVIVGVMAGFTVFLRFALIPAGVLFGWAIVSLIDGSRK